jgi:hypothetical protein
MRWQSRGVLALALSVGVSVAAAAGDLAPGMSGAAVVAVIGQPDAVRLERNGVVCLTYALDGHRLWTRLFGTRTRIVALKEDHFFEEAVVRSERVRFYCSSVAGRWDPPMREPLVCDEGWRRGC